MNVKFINYSIEMHGWHCKLLFYLLKIRIPNRNSNHNQRNITNFNNKKMLEFFFVDFFDKNNPIVFP